MNNKNYFYETWIARDKSGVIYSYVDKPNKGVDGHPDEWWSIDSTGFPQEYFRGEIEWSDTEPTKGEVITRDGLKEFIEAVAIEALSCKHLDLDSLVKHIMENYVRPVTEE